MECSGTEDDEVYWNGPDQENTGNRGMIRERILSGPDGQYMELRMTVMITKINRMGPTCGQAQMEFSERKMMNYG